MVKMRYPAAMAVLHREAPMLAILFNAPGPIGPCRLLRLMVQGAARLRETRSSCCSCGIVMVSSGGSPPRSAYVPALAQTSVNSEKSRSNQQRRRGVQHTETISFQACPCTASATPSAASILTSLPVGLNLSCGLGGFLILFFARQPVRRRRLCGGRAALGGLKDHWFPAVWAGSHWWRCCSWDLSRTHTTSEVRSSWKLRPGRSVAAPC